MRRIASVIVLLLGVFSLLWGYTAEAQTRSLRWLQWDVVIDNIDTVENRFDVREIYDIQFEGTFRTGVATIELVRLERIENIQVFEGGQALQRASSCPSAAGTFCTERQGEEILLEYNFREPLTNARQTFELAYTVIGALRVYEGGDQLWWTAVPGERFGFQVDSSTVTVELPPGFAPREGIDPVMTYGTPTDVTVNGTTVKATTQRGIVGDQSLEIRVQYPHDPNARVTGWQADFDSRRDFEENVKPLIDVGLILLSLVLAIGGPLGVYWLWYTRGRDPKVGPVPEYLSEPPNDLPPALVGTLVDETADMRDILSTVIDLGRRGYLVIEEEQEKGLFGTTSNSFTFKRTDKATSDLLPFEKRLIDRLFGGGQERSMDALKNKFYRHIPELQNNLYDELVKRQLIKQHPEKTRNQYRGFGTVLGVGAIFVGFWAMGIAEDFTGALVCVPMSLGVVGLALLAVGTHMPAKTRAGAEEAAKWNAFREYLRNIDKYTQADAIAHDVTQRFEDYLPYAVAFGIERSWIRRFAQIPTTPAPVWYYPTHRYGRSFRAGSPPPTRMGLPSSGGGVGDVARAGGGGLSLENMAGGITGGLESLSSGMTKMLESASRTLTSRPQSSGSSGSWGGGGRSFSGGGSFGGGSSGGGSRGFR